MTELLSNFSGTMVLLLAAFMCSFVPLNVDGHGLMVRPNQRGALSSERKYIIHGIDDNAPVDVHMQFPAGSKRPEPGSGRRSQIRASKNWTPYTPLERNFYNYRAGVCGDVKGNRDHLKGGKYYYNGKIVATYKQGQAIDIDIAIVAHHNGFIELHICDVSKCTNGDISPRCFRSRNCYQLQRAWEKACERGYSPNCAPTDRNYPGRWYLPCSKFPPGPTRGKWEYYGNGFIKYKLPPNLHCEHCVIQWYWVSANYCNPPGMVEYYTGPDRPRGFGTCRGQAGAVGGINPRLATCGGKTFPEEFYQCADVRIVRR